jgi:2-haloacid dehalogenase
MDAVVFDVGGVLLDWDPRHLYRKLFRDKEAMERFLAEVCTMDWHKQHDRGVSYERSCAELAAAHPRDAELIWAWARRSEEMVAGPIDGTVEIVRELRGAGVPRFLLTNMEMVTWPQRVARFPFLCWFDGAVVSGFEGVAKPDPEIFERLLERFNLAPASTLFVDDSAANLDAARSLGMQTLHFRSPAQLRRRLTDAGLLASDSRV